MTLTPGEKSDPSPLRLQALRGTVIPLLSSGPLKVPPRSLTIWLISFFQMVPSSNKMLFWTHRALYLHLLEAITYNECCETASFEANRHPKESGAIRKALPHESRFPFRHAQTKSLSAQRRMHYQTVRFSRHVAWSQNVYAANSRPHLQANDFWELLSYPSCSETTAINL